MSHLDITGFELDSIIHDASRTAAGTPGDYLTNLAIALADRGASMTVLSRGGLA